MFRSRAVLNTYVSCTWKTMHLMKLRHSNLPCNLGLFPTFRWVGLKLVVDFPSDPKPCCPRLQSFIFRPNHQFSLVRGLSTPRPTPQAPFFKPSFIGTYATHVYVRLGVEPSLTLRLTTQVELSINFCCCHMTTMIIKWLSIINLHNKREEFIPKKRFSFEIPN
jgi:hypothetical protein